MKVVFKVMEIVMFVLFLPVFVVCVAWNTLTAAYAKFSDWRWKRSRERFWRKVEKWNAENEALDRRLHAFKEVH